MSNARQGTGAQPGKEDRFDGQWTPATFIDETEIETLLNAATGASRERATAIIHRARALRGLAPDEVAVLLQNDDPEVTKELFDTARFVKESIYGNRLVFFAPLYLSNYCSNNCPYCGFRRDNKLIERRWLNQEEIAEQVRILERMGHKRLLLESGESPGRSPISYVVDAIRTVYATKEGNGSIRRVNVNIAATTVEDYRRLKAAGIGTYQLFQETYHRPTYERLHTGGPKADYDWHTTAMDRAMEGGIDDVGLGALFGLYDYRFEVLGLLFHAMHLDSKFGVGPHTISFPRWRPAVGVDFQPPYPVSDDDFKRVVAILRLAVPYTGMIISTRERPEMRDLLTEIGISQISAASSTAPGGYQTREKDAREEEAQDQFLVADHRSLDEMVQNVSSRGYIPSFCTACYRKGRTGETFMDLAKPGDIQKMCRPNALLTFKEYLVDYATDATKSLGERVVQRELACIDDVRRREETVRRIARIEAGERDLYF